MRPGGELLPERRKSGAPAWQIPEELISLARRDRSRRARSRPPRRRAAPSPAHRPRSPPRSAERRDRSRRQPRVADEGDPLSSGEARQYLRSARRLVVPLVAEEAGGNPVPVEQDPRAARVLAQNDVGRRSSSRDPQRHVLEFPIGVAQMDSISPRRPRSARLMRSGRWGSGVEKSSGRDSGSPWPESGDGLPDVVVGPAEPGRGVELEPVRRRLHFIGRADAAGIEMRTPSTSRSN